MANYQSIHTGTYIDNIISNAVTLGGIQTLTGQKNFSAPIIINTGNYLSTPYLHIISNSDVGKDTVPTNTTTPFGIGPWNGTHLEIDSNKILAKTDETTMGDLYFQWEGGNTYIGSKLEIYPNAGSYQEGIRIHAYSNWSDITLLGADTSATSGISTNSWFIGNNNGNFYITRGASNTSTNTNFSSINNSYWRLRSNMAGSISGTVRSVLHIYGPTYGNTAGELISGTAGVMRYGDGGPQIVFDSSDTPGGGQAGAIIFTDHDSCGTGLSWHFVSNQGDDNNGGNATVTAPRFRARAGLTIGQNTDNTSYNFYLNGTGYIGGNFQIGPGGGKLNGAATNGGINSILIGDDVWLGDCNAGGIMGMKSTGTNCGFYFYNSSGTQIGQFYMNGGNGYIYANKPFYVPNTGSSWIDGQRYQRGGLNLHDINNTGSYFPWIRQTNTGSAKWFSFGILNATYYMIGSPTSRTDNGYTYGFQFNLSDGKAYASGGFYTGSDRRLKKNIVATSDPKILTILNGIEVVDYNIKESKFLGDGDGDFNLHTGIIAQDLEKLLQDNDIEPHSYITKKDGLNGDEPEEEYYAMSYSELVPTLIRGWQIHEQIIQELKEKIQILEEKIKGL